MARKLKTKVRILIECVEESTEIGAGELPARLVHRFEYNKDFASGVTDGTQLDRVHSTLASFTTTPTDIDLIGTSNLSSKLDGSLNVNFTDLCVVAAANDAASGAGDLEVGGDASAPLVGMLKAGNDVAVVKPQGCFVWIAPFGVAPVATTGDILQVVATAGTIEGRSLLAGRST